MSTEAGRLRDWRVTVDRWRGGKYEREEFRLRAATGDYCYRYADAIRGGEAGAVVGYQRIEPPANDIKV